MLTRNIPVVSNFPFVYINIDGLVQWCGMRGIAFHPRNPHGFDSRTGPHMWVVESLFLSKRSFFFNILGNFGFSLSLKSYVVI